MKILFSLFFAISVLSTLVAQKTDAISYQEIDSLVGLNYQKGDYHAAIVFLKIGIKKATVDGKSHLPSLADYYGWLGYLNQQVGDYEEVEFILQKALVLNREAYGEEHINYANTVNNIAIFYLDMQKYAEAEPLILEVMERYKAITGENHPAYATILNNLGGLYLEVAEYEKAKKAFVQSKNIREQTLGKKHPLYSASLNNIAQVYYMEKNPDLALPLYQEALGIKIETIGKNHPGYAAGLNNLASTYLRLNDTLHAEQLYLEAEQVYRKTLGIKHPDYSNALVNLSRVYRTKQDYKKSAAYLYEALRVVCTTCDSSAVFQLTELDNESFSSNKEIINILENFYALYLEQYQDTKQTKFLDLAIQQIKEAFEINAKIKNEFSSDKNKLGTLKKTATLAEKALAASAMSKKEGASIDAFNFAEQNKSILLMEALKGQQSKTLEFIPDSLAEKEKALQKQQEQLQKKLYESSEEDSVQIDLLSELNRLNKEVSTFTETLKTEFPKYHQLKYDNQTISAVEIQQELDEHTLLLEFFSADTSTYVFAISKEKVLLHPIALTKTDLSNQINQLRIGLSDYEFIIGSKDKAYEQYTKHAHQLYKTLLQEVLSMFSVDNLIIIADGELGHIPFEVLLTEDAPKQSIDYKKLDYLLHQYNISYNYSATLWHENKQLPTVDKNASLLACAASYPNEVPATVGVLRSGSLYDLRTHLIPLPAAVGEVETLKELFVGDFMQDVATNEAFFKQNAKNYSVIHLAMHGILHPTVPMLSSLAFTENMDSLEDNFLQAYEIAHLNLNADLVVLSACETGFGKFEQGEGVVSLARSFMYAGVPSLVVSLWQVNDYSTAKIMQSFYSYLADGLAKDAALRQAKLDYMNTAKDIAAHPAFWSPFIQLGDNRPIALKKKGGWLPWGIGGGVLLLVLGGWFFRRKEEL